MRGSSPCGPTIKRDQVFLSLSKGAGLFLFMDKVALNTSALTVMQPIKSNDV